MTFIPYLIDHQVNNTAKTLGFSKKKVNFKFGFANQGALDAGEAGAACRGSEHEVVFIWSLKSGKRQLFLDGKDVHYSESGQNGWTSDRSWQHSFPLRDNALGQEFRLHFISQPPRPEAPNAHPFDLRVNGVSYFKFNEIWKLGSSSMMVRGHDGGREHGDHHHQYQQHRPNDTNVSAEEQRQIAMAKLESLRDLEKQQKQQQDRQEQAPPALIGVPESTPAPSEGVSLVSFEPQPPAQVIVPAPAAPAPQTAPAPAYSGMDPYAAGYAAPAPAAPAPGFAVPPAAPANTTQMAPYAGAPAPYGGLPYPQQQPPAAVPQPNPYAAPPGAAAANPYAAPPAYVPQTPSYGADPTKANPFTSPSGQTEYSYGSAPSFARPPATQQAPPPGTYGAYPPQGTAYPPPPNTQQ